MCLSEYPCPFVKLYFLKRLVIPLITHLKSAVKVSEMPFCSNPLIV